MMNSFSYFHGKKESVPITTDSQDAYSDSFFDPKISLPRLKQLEFRSVGSFKSIWPRELSQSSFDNLVRLSVSECSQLLNVFPSSVTGRLHNLEVLVVRKIGLAFLFPVSVAKCLRGIRSIEVRDCEKMEALVVDEDGRDEGTNDIIGFPLLERLDITNCPMIKSFSNFRGKKESMSITSDSQDAYSDSFFDPKISLPRLKQLEFRSVGSFKCIWPRELSQSSFDNLVRPSVSECSQLLNVFPSSVTGRLHNLEVLVVRKIGLAFLFPVSVAKCLRGIRSIEVRDCEKMEALVVDEDGRDEGTNDIIGFPLLERLDITNCPMIKSFSNFRRKKESMSITSNSQDAYSDSFFDPKVSLTSLEELQFESVRSLKSIWPRELPQCSFDNFAKLRVSKCSELLNVFSSTITRRLHNLRVVLIEECPSLETVFECGPLDSNTTEQTGVVSVSEAIRLRHVVKSDSQTVLGLPNLEEVEVIKCSKLRYLFPDAVATPLEKLKSLHIKNCEQMEEVVAREGGGQSKADVLTFPFLTSLRISQCPNCRTFIPNPTSVERLSGEMAKENDESQQLLFSEMVWFPRLESLVMDGLLDLEKILYGQPPSEYSNLKSIEIWESKSMSSILKSDWILKLLNLESLKIESSPSAEVVFDLEELKGTGHVKILSRLTKLRLSNLPNLQRICKENAQLKGMSVFRKLQDLHVSDTGLAFLFPVSVAKCLRGITDITVRDCEKMEALVVDEDGRDKGTNDIIEFSLLKRLAILNCPMMKSFSYFRGKKESVSITSDSQYAYSDSFFDPKVSLPSLEELQFESVRSLKSIWPRELPQGSFDNFAKLRVFKCSELLNVFSSTITRRLHNLTVVLIGGCPSLETVFECGLLDSNTTEQTGVVPVSEAIRLSHVVKSDSQTVLALPNLEEVNVNECPKLRYLFPYAVATTLEKLKQLEIEDCEQMKEVVAKEEGGQSKADVLTFPFLTSLSISQCPNLRAVIPNPTRVERPSGEMAKENDELQQPLFSEMVTFPSLSRVKIGGVQAKELWSNQTHDDSFCKLRHLELMECENLQHIAPSHMWKRLQRSLEILEVESCRSIETIYEGDATVVETGQLRSLILHDLENLRHIWRFDSLPNINVPFSNLMDIEVVRCPRLRMLFETFTASFLGQIKWLEVESCDNMELIADHGDCEEATCTTITFSELDGLQLIELPEIQGVLT